MTVPLRGAAPAAAAGDYRPDFGEEVKEDICAYASGAGGEEVGPRALSNSDRTSEFGRSFFQNGTIVPSFQEMLVRRYFSLEKRIRSEVDSDFIFTETAFGDLSSDEDIAIRHICMSILQDIEKDTCELFPSLNENKEVDPIFRYKEIHDRVMHETEKYSRHFPFSNLSLSATISSLKYFKVVREFKLLSAAENELINGRPFLDLRVVDLPDKRVARVNYVKDFLKDHGSGALGRFVWDKKLEVVTAFLENYQISAETRILHLGSAATKGYLDIVLTLLKNSSFSPGDLDFAIIQAVSNNHWNVANELILSAHICELQRVELISMALDCGQLDTARILLAKGAISEDARRKVILKAEENKCHDIVALLNSREDVEA